MMEKQRGGKTHGIRQSTLYVVAYDIADDKRRTKVHTILKGFGEWTEYSLFECFLTKKEVLLMQAKVYQYLNPDTDRVRIYSICEVCLDKIETVGLPEAKEETFYLI